MPIVWIRQVIFLEEPDHTGDWQKRRKAHRISIQRFGPSAAEEKSKLLWGKTKTTTSKTKTCENPDMCIQMRNKKRVWDDMG